MQEGQNARQQVVERVRQATSILVALNQNPSVDALSAALGLTLMLNKLNKHTTALFSGQTPPAIQFLEPSKHFENNIDALRDFIISLDKEKADRLRYKVEDDVVRIFITPYKTSISEKDLQFSQGDFNVDLIVALGVEKREDLDKVIVAHGRILHDATVVTINANAQQSSLGALDWSDGTASSLCEMLVGMSEAFQQPGLLDGQISTALLTGIVAATDRFSNSQTSPRVMTMAAQLMAAGANQQLIATNLAKSSVSTTPPPVAKQQASQAAQPVPQEVKGKDGELDITHEAHEQKAEPSKPPTPPPTPVPEPKMTPDEEELAAALPAASAAPASAVEELKHQLVSEPHISPEGGKPVGGEGAAAEAPEGAEGTKEPFESPRAPGSESVNAEAASDDSHEQDYISTHGSWKGKRVEPLQPPSLGGTLNATTEEALKDEQVALDQDRNKTILNHPEPEPVPETPKKSRRARQRERQREREAQRPTDRQAEQSMPVPLVPPTAPAAESPAPAPVAQSQPEPQPEPTPKPPEQPPVPQPVAPPIAPEVPPLPPLPPLPAAPETQTMAPTTPPPAPESPAPNPAPEIPPVSAPAPEPPQPPAPQPQPEPQPAPEADLEALKQSAAEAAAAAQPSAGAAGDIESARAAVGNAYDVEPFNPAGNPQVGVGAQPMPPMPDMPVAEPLSQNEMQALPPQPSAPTPASTDMPPLPPMPPMPPMPGSETALPPAPNLPGLNAPLPPLPDANAQSPSQTPPPPSQPSDPGQFKIPGA